MRGVKWEWRGARGESPDSYPPFRTRRHDVGPPVPRELGLRERDVVEGGRVDPPRCVREGEVKFLRDAGGEDVGVYLPAVFADVVALPFDQVLQAVIVHATVQDVFDDVLRLAFDQDRGWGGGTARQPGMGSGGLSVSLTTGKTGWRQRSENGRAT